MNRGDVVEITETYTIPAKHQPLGKRTTFAQGTQFRFVRAVAGTDLARVEDGSGAAWQVPVALLQRVPNPARR